MKWPVSFSEIYGRKAKQADNTSKLTLHMCPPQKFRWTIGLYYQKLFVPRKNFVMGSFCCLWKLMVSKNYETGLSGFFIRNVFMTVPKHFLGNPSVSWSSWYRKSLCILITIFRRKFFVSVSIFFVERIFWCLWILDCAWHRQHFYA